MSNKHKQAFPSEPYKYNDSFYPAQSGLTKREYAAIKAMQGILANPSYLESLAGEKSGVAFEEAITSDAIRYADKLMKQLNGQ